MGDFWCIVAHFAYVTNMGVETMRWDADLVHGSLGPGVTIAFTYSGQMDSDPDFLPKTGDELTIEYPDGRKESGNISAHTDGECELSTESGMTWKMRPATRREIDLFNLSSQLRVQYWTIQG